MWNLCCTERQQSRQGNRNLAKNKRYGERYFCSRSHTIPGPLPGSMTVKKAWYAFEWRITSGSCPPSADTVSILYKPTPGIPGSSDESRCGPGQLTLTSTMGTNGNSNRWYKTSSTDSILYTGNNYTTPVLSSTTNYWVATYNDTTGCESIRRRASAIINPVPGVPDCNRYRKLRRRSLYHTITTRNRRHYKPLV